MKPDFSKGNGLVPAIVQDATTRQVLMLGYMNEAAWEQTLSTRKVTFYSRSRQKLWVKGEASGNVLNVAELKLDCDSDAVLVTAHPEGPTCHTGSTSCFGEADETRFLYELESIIGQRAAAGSDTSYTARLLARGINKVAQKVGEEAVELVIESKDDDRDLFCGEAADLLFHFLVLLRAKGVTLTDVEQVLSTRHRG
jgi:phosphoribosyl-ATP pyrophosphohydrolase/phosphoribosyl-AMP cyclohydrolase